MKTSLTDFDISQIGSPEQRWDKLIAVLREVGLAEWAAFVEREMPSADPDNDERRYDFKRPENIIFQIQPNDEVSDEEGWAAFDIETVDLASTAPGGLGGVVSYNLSHENTLEEHVVEGVTCPGRAGWFVLEGITGHFAGEEFGIEMHLGGEVRPATVIEVAAQDPAAARVMLDEMQTELKALRGLAMLHERAEFVVTGMRSGRIAKPAWEAIERLYPDEAAEAKAQGVNAAADELEAIWRREQGDDGLDMWDAAQIIRARLSPRGWPALGIKARQLDWEGVNHMDGASGDTFVSFAHAYSTGLTYDLSQVKQTGKFEVSILQGESFDTEAEARQAAQEHHEGRLLTDLERDVMGGERTALRWFLQAWAGGQHVDLLPELVEILAEDTTAEKKAHHVVSTALRRVLAEGESQEASPEAASVALPVATSIGKAGNAEPQEPTSSRSLADRLSSLDAAASPGPWSYRPDETDDWGEIRSVPRHEDAGAPIVMVSRAHSGDRQSHDEHRAAGTDPYKANGIFVTELVNAYRAGRLHTVE